MRVGGAKNHRNTLEDGILIKDNHIRIAGGIKEALAKAKKGSFTKKVEIEVESAEDARIAAENGADIVMLDNMPPDMMAAVVAELRSNPKTAHVLFEASGGVRIETIAATAATGVDLISVGALTHSAPVLEIGADLRPLD